MYGGLSPDHRGCPTAAVVAAAVAAAEAQQEQEGAQDACEEGLLALDFWEREEGVSEEAHLPRGHLLDQPQIRPGKADSPRGQSPETGWHRPSAQGQAAEQLGPWKASGQLWLQLKRRQRENGVRDWGKQGITAATPPCYLVPQ